MIGRFVSILTLGLGLAAWLPLERAAATDPPRLDPANQAMPVPRASRPGSGSLSGVSRDQGMWSATHGSPVTSSARAGEAAPPAVASPPDHVSAQVSTAESSPGARAEAGPPASSQALRLAEQRLAQPVDLVIFDRNLETVLAEVARLGGFRIRINDRLDEVTLSRERLNGTVREVLESLARRHNLSWFAERDLIDVSKADTATVKTFNIGRISDAQIRDAMQRYGIVNADFAVEVDEKNQIARVFAPPRLTARLESIIVGLRPPQPDARTAEVINVIRYGIIERAPLEPPDQPAMPPMNQTTPPTSGPGSFLQGLFSGSGRTNN